MQRPSFEHGENRAQNGTFWLRARPALPGPREPLKTLNQGIPINGWFTMNGPSKNKMDDLGYPHGLETSFYSSEGNHSSQWTILSSSYPGRQENNQPLPVLQGSRVFHRPSNVFGPRRAIEARCHALFFR